MDDRTNMAFERIAGLTVKQSAFLVEYAKTENLSQACRVAGINRSTGYKYRGVNPEYLKRGRTT